MIQGGDSVLFQHVSKGVKVSASIKCSCGRKKGDKTDLVVIKRNYNQSAFNGYHRTYSEYSTVSCTRIGCNGMWRTKAEYVKTIQDK